MKRIVFILTVIFQISISSHSQPLLMWAQTYNSPVDNADEAVSIAVDAFGNSYVTGSAFANNGSLDMVTIKYNPSGQQLWLHNFNCSASTNDQATKLVLDNAGNVYITGYSNNLNSGQDITTIKYNTNGVLQWVQFYDGAFSGNDIGNSLCVDANGNVFVTGNETTAGFATDFITLKYNSSGALQWWHNYNGPVNLNDVGKDIVSDVNGNVYVTGSSDSLYNSQPLSTIILLKYNNSGALQWRRVFNNPLQTYSFSKKLAIDNNNNLIVVGYGGVTGQGNNYYIFKWDSSGNFQWFSQYNFGPNLYEQPNGVAIDSLNNVIVTGQGIAPSSGSTNDYVTVKYDPAGTQLWASRYNNIYHGEDRAQAVAVDDSLNIYVTGYSKGTGTNFDIATIKYDPAGNELYVLRYDNATVNRDDAGNAIAVRNGDIYIAGKSANLLNDDYITMRYSYGIPLVVNENNPVQDHLVSFPNPTHGELKIILPYQSSTANKTIHAEILNSLGQTVLVTLSLSPESIDGKSLVLINTGDLPVGIYILMLYAGEERIGVTKFVTE